MQSLLVHPSDAHQLEEIKLYLMSLKVAFEVQGDPEAADETVDDIAEEDDGKIIPIKGFRRKHVDIKPEMLKEIADMLDMGMVCFYHKTSGEMEYYPDELKNPGYDEEMWEDIINKVDKNHGDYLRFEAMTGSESFRVMEGFIGTIDDIPTHNKFISAISRKKPFRNFSDLLSYYPKLREEWFAYKNDRYIEFVKDQAEFE